MSGSKSSLLRFWRDIEIFNIPETPTKKDSIESPKTVVRDVNNDGELPWDNAYYSDTPTVVWRHIVFIGALPMEKLSRIVLQAITGPSNDLSEEFSENLSGHGWMSAFIVDSNGRPASESYVIPDYILGVEKIRENQSLDDLDKVIEKEKEDFVRRMAEMKVDQPQDQLPKESMDAPLDSDNKQAVDREREALPRMTWQHIRREIDHLFKKISGKSDLLDPSTDYGIVVKSVRRNIHHADEQEVDFLNSFYVKDLINLVKQADSNQLFGIGLEKLLGPKLEVSERIDILANGLNAMLPLVSPTKLPPGRWPANTDKQLLLAQQAAVYTILSNLRNKSGIIGVNGPPGTGKTTLLREVIADIVVERAIRLSRLNKPNQIFIDDKVYINGQQITVLDPQIVAQTGIVVASSNNRAVENISEELPNIKSLGTQFRSIQYFKPVMVSVYEVSNPGKEREIPPPVWGLIAAVLGNKNNRRTFASGFYEGKSINLDSSFDGPLPINRILEKSRERYNDCYQDWEDAKKNFTTLLDKFESRRKTLVSIEKWINELARAKKELNSIQDRIDEIEHILSELEQSRSEIQARLKELERDIADVDKEIILAHAMRPGILHRLAHSFGYVTKSYRKWLDDTEPVRKESLQNREERKTLKRQEEGNKQNIINRSNEKEQLESKKRGVNKIIDDHKSKIESSPDIGGVPDDGYLNSTPEEKHEYTLWVNEDMDDLRSKIFIAAMKLHEATIHANAARMMRGVEAVASMLNSGGSESFDKKKLETLWGYLFFIVPVISTTLASFPRLFGGMAQESIGWLLVDEAGQATPQSVAGAIWRSKRTVVIGDPLQIKPVITISKQVVHKLAEKHKILGQFSDSGISIQAVADRITQYGAWVKKKSGGGIWTGMPLRVHQRCIDPMFSIANKIAYAEQMVQGNKNSIITFVPDVPESHWQDTPAVGEGVLMVKW